MGTNIYGAFALVGFAEIRNNFNFASRFGWSDNGNLNGSIREPRLRHRIRLHHSKNRAPIILCRKGGAGAIRNDGRLPQLELKLTFAETIEERNVLAQCPISIEIVVSANKCPEEIVANPFELLSSGHLEANPVTA